MTNALIIFVGLCVLCAVLLLSALMFGSRQEDFRNQVEREEKKEAQV